MIVDQCKSKVWMPAIVFAIMYGSLYVFWRYLDHSLPSWDAANHVLDAHHYSELFRHFRPLRLGFWKEFLTVSFNYPMTQHLVFGASQLVFGPSKYADTFVNLIYWLILIGSVYGGALKLGVSRLAAILAVICVASCPLLATLSRQPLLDFGNLALLSLAFYCFLSSRSVLSWRQTWCLALILAVAGTAKQTSFLWLAGFFFWRLFCLVKQRRLSVISCGKLLVLGLPLVFSLLLWILPNYASLLSWKDYYHPQAAKGNFFVITLFEHLWSYLAFWPAIISPLQAGLVIASLVGVLVLGRSRFKPLLELSFACALGLICLSALSVNRPEARYEVPIIYLLAMVVALGFQAMAGTAGRSAKCVAPLFAFVSGLAFVQFLAFSFVPYPIPASAGLVKNIEAFVGRGEVERLDLAGYPTRDGDAWGIDWLTANIKNAGLPLNRLNILSSTKEVSVHGLEVAALRRKLTLEVSTFRRFTLHGDVFEYKADQILYYNWYLLKTGEQGFALADQKSIDAYKELEHTIRSSRNYRLVGSRSLPDKSRYDLYVAVR